MLCFCFLVPRVPFIRGSNAVIEDGVVDGPASEFGPIAGAPADLALDPDDCLARFGNTSTRRAAVCLAVGIYWRRVDVTLIENGAENGVGQSVDSAWRRR